MVAVNDAFLRGRYKKHLVEQFTCSVQRETLKCLDERTQLITYINNYDTQMDLKT